MNNRATFHKVRRILFIGFSFIFFLLPQFHTSAKTIISNDITSDTTWTKTGSPYIISTDVYVAPSVTLTIDPGVVVKFADSNGSIGVIGTLNAQGTSAKHITFTSYADDSLGGDSNNDGTSTSPVSGDFDGFYVGQNATLNLNYVDIKYAGDTLFANEGNATISNITLTKVTSGLAFYKSTSTLSSITIDTSDSYPLQFYEHSTSTINGVTIKNASSDAMLIFNHSTVTLNGAVIGDLDSSDSGALVFNDSNFTASNLSIGSSYDGISAFNQATFSGDNISVASSTDAGIFAFSNSGWNNTTISLTNSEIKNNNFGLHFIDNVTIGTIANNSIHNNTTGAKTEGTANLDFSNNWWGSDTGPTHTANTGGAGDVVSDYISYTPWLTDDPKNAGPDTYYALIANAPNGVAPLYDSPTTSGILIKTVPNDFALKIVTRKNVSGNKLVADGFEWAKVTDPTDNTTHYTPYKNVTTRVVYLPYDKNIQTNLKDISETKITDVKDRKAVILDAVNDYYNNASTTKSLFSSNDHATLISELKTKGIISKEIILGIFAHESSVTGFDNENVSFDYGHGISQITMDAYGNEPGNIYGYTYRRNKDDPRGRYSDVVLEKCSEFASEEYKKCYEKVYNNKGKLWKQSYSYYDDIQTNPIYKQYSNTAQSIYANIKDGLGILSEKQASAIRTSCKKGNFQKDGYTFSCADMQKIKTIWYYNGMSFRKDQNYMEDVSKVLKKLSSYFPGYSFDNSNNLIEKLVIANKYRQEIKDYSPVETQVLDSSGNILVGVENGTIVEDNEYVGYDENTGRMVIFFPEENYTYKVTGDNTIPNGGSYGLSIQTYNGNNNPTEFSALDIETKTNEIHTFSVDQVKLANNDPDAVTLAIDTNGDGTAERTIETGKELVTASPYDFYFKKIVDGGQYKVNKVLPVRIRVTSASKGKIPLQHPWIKITRVSDGYKASINPNKLDEDGQCDSDDDCFTKHHNRYILNIPKNTLTAGDWKIEVGLDDAVVHSIVVTMIK